MVELKPMGAARANYAADRMLWRMNQWHHYAVDPPKDLDHAKDKLAALARVMRSMIGDINEKRDWSMIGDTPSEAYENDGSPLTDVRIAETYARWSRQGHTDAL